MVKNIDQRARQSDFVKANWKVIEIIENRYALRIVTRRIFSTIISILVVVFCLHPQITEQ